MKILKYTLATGLVVMMAACSEKQADTQTTEENTPATDAELQQALADRDTLISIMTDINNGVMQIKELESIVTIDNGETPNKRAQIIRDINAIKLSIADRQKRLAELEQKLSTSSQYTAQLKENIAQLRSQIESQEADIARLTSQLGVANETIATQTAQIDTLNTTVQNVSTELAQSQESNLKLTNEINTCYYAVGSSKNLKDNKILEKKFLRSEKIMKGDFNQAYFTTADKRTLSVIPLYAKKAEVKTNQPKSSYELRSDPSGQLELVITNPGEFWKLTDYLVVETK